jgi:hypothetical protein
LDFGYFYIIFVKNKYMQTLKFNTTKKTATLSSTSGNYLEVVATYDNVPTVKVLVGYYEVMQTVEDNRVIPVLRVPISNTNMIIER